MNSLDDIKKRMESARRVLPAVTARHSKLSAADQRLVGPMPKAIKTRSDMEAVDRLADRFGISGAVAAPTPEAKPPVTPAPEPSLGAQALQSVLDPATRGAAVAGLEQSLAARLGLKQPVTCTRSEFDSLTHPERNEYMRSGGKIRADDAKPVPPISADSKAATLAQFNNLSHSERNAFMARGGKLTK